MTRKEEIIVEASNYANNLTSAVDATDEAYANLGFANGAKWADKTLIDKACKWLKQNMLDNNAFQSRLYRIDIIDGIVNNFRKAMEE